MNWQTYFTNIPNTILNVTISDHYAQPTEIDGYSPATYPCYSIIKRNRNPENITLFMKFLNEM